MKNTLKIMTFVLLAFVMLACGEKERKLTQDDLKAAEATLFNEDMTVNDSVVTQVVEQYCLFVEQNPNDATAPDWLFKALEISVSRKDVEKSVAICDKMMQDYPRFDKTPIGMYMVASFIYEDQLHDFDKARTMYERIISDYPENEIIPSVQASLKNLGKTPEEIIREFELMQTELEVEEGDR